MIRSMHHARRYLYAHGWQVSNAALRAAFPGGPPATTYDLREWASRTLQFPVARPPRPPREPGLSPADAVDLLRAEGQTATVMQVIRAMKDGSLRLTGDGRLLHGELVCWARKHLPAPAVS